MCRGVAFASEDNSLIATLSGCIAGWILDKWVFERVHRLFDEIERNDTLRNEVSRPKTMFFLHLLGIDTNGHAHRPYSK